MWNPLRDDWEEHPTFIRRRDLRTTKYEQEKRDILMSRPVKNSRRSTKVGVSAEPKGPSLGSEKQYKQSGKKYSGPNYPQTSVTGVLQNGSKGSGYAK